MYIFIYIYIYAQMDRQIDMEIYSSVLRYRNRQLYPSHLRLQEARLRLLVERREMDIHIHTYILMDRQIDRQIDRRMNGQMDIQIDRQIDRQRVNPLAPPLPSTGGATSPTCGAQGDGGAEKCIYLYIYIYKDGQIDRYGNIQFSIQMQIQISPPRYRPQGGRLRLLVERRGTYIHIHTYTLMDRQIDRQIDG